MTKHRGKIQHALRVFCPGALQTNREMARDMKKHGFPPKGWGIDWKTCKKFKLSEHWAEEWAKFSGRPRGRHEQTIGETVHEAQELLCALALGAERKTLADDRDMCHFDYMKDKWVGYVSNPKSIGELCLECYEDALRFCVLDWPEIHWNKHPGFQKLRELMWQ